MYAPMVKSARTVRRYRWAQYEAVFLDQVVSLGSIQYEFIMAVFEQGKTAAFLYVTSERNAYPFAPESPSKSGQEPGSSSSTTEASYFLCLFEGNTHHNLGLSSDWGDAHKFEEAAFRILAERLGSAPGKPWQPPTTTTP